MKSIFIATVLIGLGLAGAAAAQTTALSASPIVGAGLAAASPRAYSPVAQSLSVLPGFQSASSLLSPRKVCIVNLGVQSQGRAAVINNRVNAQNLRVNCR